MKRSSRSTPTGPGSRGGRFHIPEWRRAYDARWRANNPEYREAERLRKARARAAKRGEDPTLVLGRPVPGRLPTLTIGCASCGEPIPGLCGFCAERERTQSKRRRWTPLEDALVRVATDLMASELAAHLGRTTKAVWVRRWRLRRLGQSLLT